MAGQSKKQKQEEETQENPDLPAQSEQAAPKPLLNDEFRMGADGLVNMQTGEKISMEEIDKKLESAEKGMELTSEYHEFQEGDEVRILYVGDTHIQGMDGNPVPAVRFYIPGEEKMKINASNVIVSTLQQNPVYTSFSIYCKGKTKGSSGYYYFDYKIQELVIK